MAMLNPLSTAPLVFVIDDERAVREALCNLFESVGFRVAVFGSAADMLGQAAADVGNCLVLDIRLPDMSGLQFQERLAAAEVEVPVIFMTGHADIRMSVRAMKAGAVDFLTKPFRDQDMLDAVTLAVALDRERRRRLETSAIIRSRFDSLSSREREVMTLVARGLMNKQVAGELGLSEVTIKCHRREVMRKMEVRSFADLMRHAIALGVGSKCNASGIGRPACAPAHAGSGKAGASGLFQPVARRAGAEEHP